MIKANLKILFIEDSNDDVLLLINEIKKGGYNVEWKQVETKKDMVFALENEKWDIVIVDYNIPNFNGIEALNILKEKKIEISAIMVSGKMGEETAVEAMIAGANDYIIKGSYARLVPAIKRELNELKIKNEKKIIENQLKESEKKFRTFMETAIDLMYIADENGVFTFVNKSMLNTLGYSKEKIMNMSIAQILDNDIIHNFNQKINELPEKGIITNETVWIKQNGKKIYGEITIVAIYNKSGFIGSRGVFHDITRRKLAENDKEKLNQNLIEKNNELENFLYITSHDLRSPLVNIQGFCSELMISVNDLIEIILKKNNLETIRNKVLNVYNTEIKEAISFIDASIIKMDLLLSAILKLCRTDNNKLTIEKLDMNVEIDEVLKLFYFVIEKNNIKLNIDKLPSCYADKIHINQLLSNIIDNAIKYRNLNKPSEIKISGKIVGNNVEYCIEDNGVGIDPEYIDKIFDIFYQINPNKSQGQGIGMTIARKIINKMNGKIYVESNKGTGSRFYILLPFKI